MAKTIKFNLICDGNPVRNLEDLQNNFSIEDILDYYHNKLLHRWLKVRGYEKELRAVNEITAEEPIDIAKTLISIFDIEANENSVAENVYILDYSNERKDLYSIYEEEGYKVRKIIDDYQTGYIQLIDNILHNPDNYALIKTTVNEIIEQYPWVFALNHREAFYLFFNNAPAAIFALLSNPKTRDYYLPVKLENDDVYDIDLPENTDKKNMYKHICRLTTEDKLAEILKDNLKTYSGVTDGYWKDLEEKGARYMILRMDFNDFVRSAGVKDGDLGKEDINDRFVILNGIDYKSNSATHTLFYMEV